MSIADYFRGVRTKTEEESTPLDKLVRGARTVGHIIEISNGYIVVLSSTDVHESIAIYVPTLEKIGEALAAHKTKQKFLNEPEKIYGQARSY